MITLPEKRTATYAFVGLLAFFLGASVLAACQVEDLIKVDVPPEVARAVETEERVTVADSQAVWEDWVAWVDRQTSRLEQSIAEGQERVGLIRSLTEAGISIGQDAASTLPGGALISAALAGLGGLFLRRPGDATRERLEKEASYNAGLEKGRQLAGTVQEALEDLKEAQG